MSASTAEQNLELSLRVNDKVSGDYGHPVQYDYVNNNWFVHTNNNSDIYQFIIANPGVEDGNDFVSTISRKSDNRSLDDKLYRFRYVIPKEADNAKPPTPGYVIQASSSTGARNNDDFILDRIGINDYGYNRNPRYIVNIQIDGTDGLVRSELPHQLSVGDTINIVNVSSKQPRCFTYPWFQR